MEKQVNPVETLGSILFSKKEKNQEQASLLETEQASLFNEKGASLLDELKQNKDVVDWRVFNYRDTDKTIFHRNFFEATLWVLHKRDILDLTISLMYEVGKEMRDRKVFTRMVHRLQEENGAIRAVIRHKHKVLFDGTFKSFDDVKNFINLFSRSLNILYTAVDRGEIDLARAILNQIDEIRVGGKDRYVKLSHKDDRVVQTLKADDVEVAFKKNIFSSEVELVVGDKVIKGKNMDELFLKAHEKFGAQQNGNGFTINVKGTNIKIGSKGIENAEEILRNKKQVVHTR